jgi:hypothetical protein
MAEDPKDQDPGAEDPKDGDPGAEDPKDDDDPDDQDPKDDPKKDLDPELKKAQKRRDAALARAQKAEEEAARLREKYEKKDEDPEVRANRKLVAAETRVVLTEAGVPKDDHSTVMKYLALDDVAVGTDGTVDSDTIQERVEELVRIFGGRKEKKAAPRLDTRDRGGDRAKPSDAASKRRREMLRG